MLWLFPETIFFYNNIYRKLAFSSERGDGFVFWNGCDPSELLLDEPRECMGGADFAVGHENVARFRGNRFEPIAELLFVRMGRETADFGDFCLDGNFFTENSDVFMTVQNVSS